MITSKTIVIVGPTASGKSELAQRLCEKISGEVISADSMQIYKGLDIGTGKVKKEDQRVAHHLLSIIDPKEPFSAAIYQDLARKKIKEIHARGNVPMIVGGTGFYIRGVVDDYNFEEGEQKENPIREKYQNILENEGKDKLWEILLEADPKSANVIEKNDSKRVIRALELATQGKSYATNKESLKEIDQLIPTIWIGLFVDRDVLADRISDRVDNMIKDGLIDEVSNLLDSGLRDTLCSSKAIGYKEIVDYIDGKVTLDEATNKIKTNTRRYAKRQRTWFRSEKRINWIDANQLDFSSLTNKSLEIIKNNL
jgi:tRNA dimethylallyltransferase